MDNSQDTPPAGTQWNEALSGDPPAQLVERIRDLLAQERLEAALQLFNTLHPADQGDVLVDLPRDSQQDLLTAVPPEDTADILELLKSEEAVQVSEPMDPEALADILDEASPDVAADVLRNIPPEQSEETLESMIEASEVIPLLEYADDTAGGLMMPDYSSVKKDVSTGNALDTLRLAQPEDEHTSQLLVVDNDNRLVGALSLVRLALARPSAIVQDIMERDIRAVTAETDQEDCARLMQRYELSRLPVVEEQGRLLGVILGEDVYDVAEEEATEDMLRMAGVGDETVFGPLLRSARSRLPWLYVNLGTAFLAAVVIGLFESTIARVLALAVFLPVVPGQGGMGGVQTLTLIVRSMALGEVPGHRGLRLVARELFLGLSQGLLLGLVVGLVAYLWKGSFMLGLILALAMAGNMAVAGLTGAGVPLLLRRLRVDPAVSAAVFITTVTDVVGLLLFLGLGALMIK